MRARNIKPGFFKNAELADAGPIAQLLFAGLWLMADKEGRLKDQPRVIKAELFPYYDADVNGELTVLERLGHIRRYVTSGIAVVEILNFKKHQSPHHTERASDLPAYEHVSDCKTTSPVIHGELTVNSRKHNGGNPSDSLIPDSLIPDSPNHVSDNALRSSSWHAPAQSDSEFDAIKAEYPPFSGRQNWITAEHHAQLRITVDGLTWQQLRAAVQRYARYCEQGGVSDTRYVLSPVRFFSDADKPWLQPWEPPKPKASMTSIGNSLPPELRNAN